MTWIFEFQKAGDSRFHLFSSSYLNPKAYLADVWNEKAKFNTVEIIKIKVY